MGWESCSGGPVHSKRDLLRGGAPLAGGGRPGRWGRPAAPDPLRAWMGCSRVLVDADCELRLRVQGVASAVSLPMLS